MEIGQLISLLLGSAGILGFTGTVYQVRKNAATSQATTKVEAAAQQSADWASFTARIQATMDYQDGQIEKLRSEITELKNDRTYDREHIRILQKQIWAQLPPPPMKPGDPFPEDQVGG